MGLNLSNPNDVRGGISSLFGKLQPFVGMAMPLLRKISPKIRDITGYSVDELYNELSATTRAGEPGGQSQRGENLYDKYKNL